MERRTFIRGAAAVCAGMAFGKTASAANPIVLKFSHVIAPDTPKGRGADKFRELVDQYTQGRVKVEVYPNAQLFKDKEELEALQMGAVQMIAPSLAKFGPIGAREFEVFDLPFLFPDLKAVQAVCDGPVGKRLLDGLGAHGITGLTYWDNGFRVFTAKRALRKPADFRGLKLRIQSSKVLDAQARALGAFPQILASSELYQALDTGVVDAAETDRSNIYTGKLYEVQKSVTLSDHGFLGYAIIANKTFMEGLAPDLRAGIEKAMAEATQFVRDVAHKLEVEAEDEIRKTGKMELIKLSDTERQAWVERLQPVFKQVEGRIGAALIQDVRAAIQQAAK